MNIQFWHTNGNASLVETEGDNISLTYDHLWDKTGKQPILIAWFDGNLWWREDTNQAYTDITISHNPVYEIIEDDECHCGNH